MAVKGTIKGSAFLTMLGLTLQVMDDGTVTGSGVIGAHLEGPPAHMHGGAIATVLDEAMGAAAHLNGYQVVAARLQFNYKRAIPIGSTIQVRAWVAKVEDRKIYGESEILLPDNVIAVSGEGLFVKAPKFFDQAPFSLEKLNPETD